MRYSDPEDFTNKRYSRNKKAFQPGEDLIVSSSAKETIDLVKYYLNNPKECMKIKEAGMNKVKKYSYEQRAKYIIKTIIEAGLISGRLLKTGKEVLYITTMY